MISRELNVNPMPKNTELLVIRIMPLGGINDANKSRGERRLPGFLMS